MTCYDNTMQSSDEVNVIISVHFLHHLKAGHKADFRLEWSVSIYLDNLGQRCTTQTDTILCNQSHFNENKCKAKTDYFT